MGAAAALLLLGSSAACEAGAPARVRASTTPADSASGEIPFRLAGPGDAAIIVPVFVNGQGPFDFVLDTGAPFTCLEPALSRRLGLWERRSAVGVGAGIGGAGQVRLVRVDSLRVSHVVELRWNLIRSAESGSPCLVKRSFISQYVDSTNIRISIPTNTQVLTEEMIFWRYSPTVVLGSSFTIPITIEAKPPNAAKSTKLVIKFKKTAQDCGGPGYLVLMTGEPITAPLTIGLRLGGPL
jgi:hypothetical protein